MIILEEIRTPFGKITITRSKKDGTCTYQQDDCLHSAINEQGISTCAYIHVIHSIIQQSQAQRVLVIGCAGGSLAYMLHMDGCQVTVVDINPISFSIAQTYFHMPAAVTCVVQDGSAYLAKTKKRYDAIVIDAFDNDGSIPDQFMCDAFFLQVRDCLLPKGIVIMNIISKHDMDKRSHHIAGHMNSAGIPAILFDTTGIENRNTIIAGGIANHVRIPCGKEPAFIINELRDMVRLRPILF